MTAGVLGLDIGGTTVKGAVVTADGSVVAQGRRSTACGSDAAVAAVVALAVDLADAASGSGAQLVAGGAVTPGVLDPGQRVVAFASNLRWSQVALAASIEEDLGVPVQLANDATAAGLAEGRFGRARGCGDFLHVTLGTGIGACLVVGGRPVLGAGRAAGELGHITVFPDGDVCACGRRGCLDAYAAAAGLLRRYRAAGGTAAETVPALIAGLTTDAAARQVWDDAILGLARGLATVTMLTDPALVVLGGGLAGAGDALTGPLRRRLTEELGWRAAPQVELSALGDRGGVAGALAVAVDLLGEPSAWPLTRLAAELG